METCQGATTQGYVADWEDRCVVVFEGTHDFSSLVIESDTAYYHASRNCGQACLDDDIYISCDSVVGSQAQANSYRFYSEATLPEKHHPSVERRLYRVAQN